MTLLTANWVWPDTMILIVAVVLIALFLNLVLKRAIRIAVRRTRKIAALEHDSKTLAVLSEAAGLENTRAGKRAETVGSLLQSVTTVVIWTIAILTILDAVGVPMMSVLASAGIGGVALAFGAQSLVKDVLSGIFMIFEDQYGVGDFIDTGEIRGTVEDIGLRVTRIRDLTGGIWYIRNGEITRIGNQTQGYATEIVRIPVHPDEEDAQVTAILSRVADQLNLDTEWSQKFVEPLSVLGLAEIDATAHTHQIMAKCKATEQSAIRREILSRSLQALREAGVRGPRLPSVK